MTRGIEWLSARSRLLLSGSILAVVAPLLLPGVAAADPVPLAQIGSTGTNAGQFVGPDDIAIDGSGNLFVSDLNNHRINEFTAAGGFIRTFGWDVVPGGTTGFEVCTSGCKAGLPGGGAGQMNGPTGLALTS